MKNQYKNIIESPPNFTRQLKLIAMRNLILLICCLFFCSNQTWAQCQGFNPTISYNTTNGTNYTFSVTNYTGSPTAVTWAWDFGDGGTSNLFNPTHTYNSPANYTVCLVANCQGEEVESCIDIEVIVASPPCDLGPDQIICIGQSTTLNITGTWVLIEWYYNGNLIGTGNSISVSNQGTYCVVAYYADGTICEDCIDVNVEDCPPPNPSGCPLFALRQATYLGPPCFGDLHLEELDKSTSSVISSVFVNGISTGIGLEYDGIDFYTVTSANDCYNPNSLVTIDEATGNTTVIANLTGLTVYEGDISFNPVDNELYMVIPNYNTPNFFEVYHIDKTTGTTNRMGDYTYFGAGTAEISSMSFEPSGDLKLMISVDNSGASFSVEAVTISGILAPMPPISFVSTLNNTIITNTSSCYRAEGMDYDPITGNFCWSYHDINATNWGHGSNLYELGTSMNINASVNSIPVNCSSSDYSESYSGLTLKCGGDYECDLGPDQLICPGQSVTLSLNMSFTGGVDWYLNNVFYAHTSSSSITVSSVGTYCAYALDSFGAIVCEDCMDVLPDDCPPTPTCCPLYGLVQIDDPIAGNPNCFGALDLVEVNKVTGSFISTVSVSGITTGIGLEHDASISPNFYTVTQSNDCFAPNTLHEINCVTGFATPIGTGLGFNVTEGDLSFDSVGNLYMVTNSGAPNSYVIYYLDRSLGVAPIVFTYLYTGAGSTDVSSISFDNNDNLVVMLTINNSGVISVEPIQFNAPVPITFTTTLSNLSLTPITVGQASAYTYESMDYDAECNKFCWAYHDVNSTSYPYNVTLYELDNLMAITGSVATNLTNTNLPTTTPKKALSGLALKCGSDTCVVNVTLPQDTLTICEGESIQLNPIITGGVAPYNCTWSPTIGVFPVSTNGCDVIIQPTATTTYTVTVIDAAGCVGYASMTLIVDTTCCCPTDDILINGDFNAGNTGFSNGYSGYGCAQDEYYVDVSTLTCFPGLITVVNEPFNLGGNYLITNGVNNFSGGPHTAYNTGSIPLTAGNNYTFNFHYYPDLTASGAMPTTVVEVYDIVSATVLHSYTPTVTPGQWDFISFQWTQLPNSGSTVVRVQQFFNANSLNDSGFDNFMLCCKTPTDTCDIEVTLPQNALTICHNEMVRMDPTIIGGTAPFTCSWTPTANVYNPTDCNPVIIPQANTTYTVTVTDAVGCIATASMTILIDTTCCCTLDQSLLPNGGIDLGFTGFNSSLPQGVCPLVNLNEAYIMGNSTPCYSAPNVTESLNLGGDFLAGTYNPFWVVDYNNLSFTAGNEYCFFFDIYPDIDHSGNIPQIEIQYTDGQMSYSIPVGGIVAGQWNHVRYCWTQPINYTSGFVGVYMNSQGVPMSTALDNLRLCCEPGDGDVPPPSWELDSGGIGTGVDTKIGLLEDINISVYPNPSSGIITIDSNHLLSQKVSIYDINGKLIEALKLSNNSKIDISNLQSGIYFLKVNSNDHIYTKRIIKQ